MKFDAPVAVIWGLWILFLVYWAISARKSKKAKRRESVAQRLGYILPLVLTFVLLSRPEVNLGWLSTRLLPFNLTVRWTGAVLAAGGIAICLWARRHLGTNWSGTVTLKEGHELIRSGPYRAIRHPIYSGILLALLGTAVEIGQLRAFAAVIVAWISFYLKARREESFLTDEFGEKFRTHAQHTGMFLPRFS